MATTKNTANRLEDEVRFQHMYLQVGARADRYKWRDMGPLINPITDPRDWYIYLHEWLIFMVNIGKYTIHGTYRNGSGVLILLMGVITPFITGRGPDCTKT